MTVDGRRRLRTLAQIACAAFLAAAARAAEDGAGGVMGQVRIASANVKKGVTIVYLDEVSGEYQPSAESPEVRSVGKAFVPRVIPVLAGTTVVFRNEEAFVHRPCNLCLIPKKKAKVIDFGNWSNGDKRSFTFKEPGIYTQACSIHAEMTGYVVVLQNPYFAVADEDGKFRIADVPAGSYKLKAWNEGLRQRQLDRTYDVKVARGGVTDVVLEPESSPVGDVTAR